MINLQNIEGYGIADPGFELLREVAQKYCPEELQAERKEVIPDEVLNLAALSLPFELRPSQSTGNSSTLPKDDGFGIGIPETQKLRDLHYEETDMLDAEQIKRDFPVLQQ
jgi:cysteine desulfurase/selenocysteine lyase